MKRILIGILIFVLYLALIIWGGIALNFDGTKLILFCLILGLLGAAAVAFVLWYLHRLNSGSAAGNDTPDTVNLNSLLRGGNARIRQGGRAPSMASMPLIYVIGDENSAKTQTVLQSGLDPELLAGNVYQDGVIVPTELINLWLAGNYILVEAGGALIRRPSLWLRLVKATLPARLGSAFSKDSRLPARSVLVCVSIERILAPNTTEQIRSLAQTLNERLRQLSQTLGISLPIYVLFTKMDNIAPFGSYVSRLSEEEVKVPIGSLLSAPESGSGLYTEQATALISSRFDQLLYALSEFRLDILSRGGELKELAQAYEFPRDLRKLRSGIVSFLTEVARPSQIGVNPFLRGFFFTGMRAHMVEDVIDVGPAPSRAPISLDAGATRIFSVSAAQASHIPAPQSRSGGMRKVPQWVFLPQLFSKILLADKSALETSRASTRTNFLRRALLATASGVLLILLTLITISFFNNLALERRVAASAAAPVSPVASGAFASLADLQSLENLRAVLDELRGYNVHRPLLYRMGLYQGEALYLVACRAYANKFSALLLAPTQAKIVEKLSALSAPPPPDAIYSATYDPLKAYIITTSNPDPDTDQDTRTFLPQVLAAEWAGNAAPTADISSLAKTQFTFYAELLPGASSCLAMAGGAPNEVALEKSHAYLNGFKGYQHIYLNMLSAANRRFKDFTFNERFPGSSTSIIDHYRVQGAFSKEGYVFMQNAISHPNVYFGGEKWVLQAPPPTEDDLAKLSVDLQGAYTKDYIKAWQDYLNSASYVPSPFVYKDFEDAGHKLSQLDVDTSPLLELFWLLSVHTASASPEIATVFQTPQKVVSASSPEQHLIGGSNQKYITDLKNLEQAIREISINTTNPSDQNAAQPIVGPATTAQLDTDDLVPRPQPGSVEQKSFDLLEAPIKAAENLAQQAPLKAAGAGAKAFCDQQIAPLLKEFPFKPDATTEATTEEVAQVFAPGSGSFAKYISTLQLFVTQQGPQFYSAQPTKVPVNPAFLSFLGKAQRISSALFPPGSNKPSLDFTLTEPPGAPNAVLTVDDQKISTDGQKVQFRWESRPDGKTSIALEGNSRTPPGGPWSVFHLGFVAEHNPPNRLKYNLQTNNQTNGVALFDASGPGAELLNKDFMKGFQCVSNVAR